MIVFYVIAVLWVVTISLYAAAFLACAMICAVLYDLLSMIDDRLATCAAALVLVMLYCACQMVRP